MIVQLIFALILTSLVMTAAGLVADTREQSDLKSPCTNESTVGCTKLGGKPDGAKTGSEHETAERKTVNKPDPIVVLMDEISRLKQELMPMEASKPSNTQNVMPASVAVPVSSQPAASGGGGGNRSVCEKSLAVGTLGYRILCQPSKRIQRQENQKQQSRDTPKVANPSTASDAAMSQERAELPEHAEAGELRRLRSLFEQLNKRGNFRPIVEVSSPE